MNKKKLAELIPHLKCIRCGSKEDLQPFKQTIIADIQGGIYAHIKSYSTLVPTCKSCYQGFKSVMSSRKRMVLYLLLSILVFITLCMGIFFVATQFSDTGILVLTGHIFIFIISIVITRRSFFLNCTLLIFNLIYVIIFNLFKTIKKKRHHVS